MCHMCIITAVVLLFFCEYREISKDIQRYCRPQSDPISCQGCPPFCRGLLCGAAIWRGLSHSCALAGVGYGGGLSGGFAKKCWGK